MGSLPFASAEAAIRAVAELSPEIPFWPQLPVRAAHEGMISQGLGLLDGLIEPRNAGYGFEIRSGLIDVALDRLRRSAGDLAPRSAAGFAAFETALGSGAFGLARAVKGQIEGPVTLATYLFYRGRPFIAEPVWFSAVAFHVSQMVCWQVSRLRGAGLPVIIVIDEPALCLDPPPTGGVTEELRTSALAAVLDSARNRGALPGLHCCAALPFDRMFLARPALISFDASAGLEAFFARPELAGFVRGGGIVAYGLIPTRPVAAPASAAAIFSRWWKAAALAGDPEELARGAMVTATCGLGLLDVPAVRESFELAHGVGRLFGRLCGSPESPMPPDRS